MSLVVQFSATSLIVWKIWHTTAWGNFTGGRNHLAVIWIVIESGSILTAATVTLLTLYLVDTNPGGIITFVIAQISLAVPASIIIRSTMKHPSGESSSAPLALSTFKTAPGVSSSQTPSDALQKIRLTAAPALSSGFGTSSQDTIDAKAKMSLDVAHEV
ncbi:hypothetical protein PsYK624_062260 [Phanerochaete sordida]|uniref:Uncharacterized protein n=1 Tax=Phanerochaete sordida TaxID=48140 RepID=A0A9P3LD95_9APHY|nr:hypothetical protein PsYK624_062260 [Phanerochaete sordida]